MTRLPERIESKGIVLRRWRSSDAEDLARAIEESMDHLRPWMAWIADEPLPLTRRIAMLEQWESDWRAGADAYYGIFVGGQIVGGCGLHRRRGPDTLEIGYWTHPSFLRRGIAITAAGLLTQAALAHAGIRAVEIHHDKANTASAGVPRRLGFRFVGESEDGKSAPAELGIDCAWRLERHVHNWPALAR
jgi:ribosomal-protein-serine acetyltransferase